MKDYMVFRAVVPPGFDLQAYAERSNEPIRYDTVTVVEAESGRDAVNAVIAATGVVATGFAVIECEVIGFAAQSKLGRGGKLVMEGKQLEATNGEDW